jgi:acyl-CoA reductase-like NAD-dependent aldehyde dehydrogenase
MATNGSKASSSKFNSSSTLPLWLDGKEVTTSSTFDVISPIDHQKLYACAAASEEDALAAVASAEKAFKTWSKTKPSQRRDIFLRAAEEFAKRRDECYQYTHTETGAAESMFEFEFGLAIDNLKAIAGLISAVVGTIPTLGEEGKSAMLMTEPYGVVLGMSLEH